MKSPIHLNALRAFEASARHQSFSVAAEELNVTAAAVGQLVRTLEDWLGAPLFERSSSGRQRLRLTDAAALALPDIRAGFDRLLLGMKRLRDGATCGILTVTVSPAFAAKWLLPRIDRFQSSCPDIDIRLDTNHNPVDFLTQRIDVGVRYGNGNWPGLQADKLLDEEVYPVCAPALLRPPHRLRNPGDLAHQTLIHDLSMEGHADFPSWETWFSSVGVVGIRLPHGLHINNSAAVLQAAAEGHGIALARSVMVRDDLSAGRLVRLFPTLPAATALAYYVVYRPECAGLPRLAAFRNWLMTEVTQA